MQEEAQEVAPLVPKLLFQGARATDSILTTPVAEPMELERALDRPRSHGLECVCPMRVQCASWVVTDDPQPANWLWNSLELPLCGIGLIDLQFLLAGSTGAGR